MKGASIRESIIVVPKTSKWHARAIPKLTPLAVFLSYILDLPRTDQINGRVIGTRSCSNCAMLQRRL